jgi:hypothetical protein
MPLTPSLLCAGNKQENSTKNIMKKSIVCRTPAESIFSRHRAALVTQSSAARKCTFLLLSQVVSLICRLASTIALRCRQQHGPISQAAARAAATLCFNSPFALKRARVHGRCRNEGTWKANTRWMVMKIKKYALAGKHRGKGGAAEKGKWKSGCVSGGRRAAPRRAPLVII